MTLFKFINNLDSNHSTRHTKYWHGRFLQRIQWQEKFTVEDGKKEIEIEIESEKERYKEKERETEKEKKPVHMAREKKIIKLMEIKKTHIWTNLYISVFQIFHKLSNTF